MTKIALFAKLIVEEARHNESSHIGGLPVRLKHVQKQNGCVFNDGDKTLWQLRTNWPCQIIRVG